MKVTVFGELLLLLAIGALAYFMYVQQAQLVELELELDKVRGAFSPVPAAEGVPGGPAAAAEAVSSA